MALLKIYFDNRRDADDIMAELEDFLGMHFPAADINESRRTVKVELSNSEDMRDCVEMLIQADILDPHEHDYRVD